MHTCIFQYQCKSPAYLSIYTFFFRKTSPTISLQTPSFSVPISNMEPMMPSSTSKSLYDDCAVARTGNYFARFHGSQQAQTCRLLQLPDEILLAISKHLPASSACCFALTCKRLFSFPLFSDHNRITSDDNFRRGLLPLLEKVVATHFYCHRCNRLHWFDKIWNPKYIPFLPHRDCYAESKFLNHGKALEQNLPLSYRDVRLVMNRYFHGPTHGLPLEALVVSYMSTQDLPRDDIYSRNNISWSETWTPRIIGDELFLLGKFEVFYPYRFS